MYARVVRFTDVTPERIAGLKERLAEADGPPEGVPSSGVQFLHDADQGTMVVVQLFGSMDDLKAGEAVLSEMDSSETPGTRGTIDRCEVIAELPA